MQGQCGALDVPAGPPAPERAIPNRARPRAAAATADNPAGASCPDGRDLRPALRTAGRLRPRPVWPTSRTPDRWIGRSTDRANSGSSTGYAAPRSCRRSIRSMTRSTDSAAPTKCSGGRTFSAAMSSVYSAVCSAASCSQSTPVWAARLEQRVVDVGDVLDVLHRQARVSPDPVEQIERHVGVRVPEVGCVVRGDAADVHPDRTRSRPDADDEARSGVEGLGLGRGRGDRKSRHLGRRPGLHPATLEEGRECRVSQTRLWTDDEESMP